MKKYNLSRKFTGHIPEFFICSFLKTCRWVFSAFGCDRWNGTFETLLPFFMLIQLVIAFAWAFVRNFRNSFPFITSFVLCFVWPCSFVSHLVWTFLLWQENRRTISWKFHHHRLWSIDSLGWTLWNLYFRRPVYSVRTSLSMWQKCRFSFLFSLMSYK